MRFKNLKKYYPIHLVLVILLALGFLVFVKNLHSTQNLDAERLNYAGSQLMLSQLVGQKALLLSSSTNKAACDQYNDILQQLQNERKKLSSNRLTKDISATFKENLTTHLEQQSQVWNRFISKAQALSRSCQEGKKVSFSQAQEIVTLGDQLLKSIEQEVSIYETDAFEKNRLEDIYGAISFAIVVGLFFLISAGFFLPLFSRYQKEHQTLLKTIDSLETEKASRFDMERQLHDVINYSGLEIWSINQKGQMIFGNKRFFKALHAVIDLEGQPEDLNLFEVFEQQQKVDNWKVLYERAFKGNSTNFQHERGDSIYDVTISPLYNHENKITGAVGVASDVTTSAPAKKELSSTFERLPQAMECSKQGLWHWYFRDDTLELHENFARLHGYQLLERKLENRPVIIAMKTNAKEGDREKFIESGMDDYISIPINIKAIESLLIKVA